MDIKARGMPKRLSKKNTFMSIRYIVGKDDGGKKKNSYS